MKSWEATHWARKIIICPNGEPITRMEKLLLQIIADYHNERVGAACVPARVLASNALLSERHLYRLLGALKRKQLLRVEKGRAGENRYVLNTEAPARRPPIAVGSSQWAPEYLWLKNFLRGPECFFVPMGALDADPDLWHAIAADCGGLSQSFVRATFVQMRSYLRQHPEKRPNKSEDWRDFVRRWFEWHVRRSA